MNGRRRDAIVDANIASLGPSVSFEFLLECFYVGVVEADQHADAPDAFDLLGARSGRPRRRAETDQEFASSHGHPRERDRGS